MRDLHTLAVKHHVSTVFFETIANPDTAKTLAGDPGRTCWTRWRELPPSPRDVSYIEVMQSNLVALQRALGAK